MQKVPILISFYSGEISQIENLSKQLCCRINETHFLWCCKLDVLNGCLGLETCLETVFVCLVSRLGLGAPRLPLGLGWFWKQLSLSRSHLGRRCLGLGLGWSCVGPNTVKNPTKWFWRSHGSSLNVLQVHVEYFKVGVHKHHKAPHTDTSIQMHTILSEFMSEHCYSCFSRTTIWLSIKLFLGFFFCSLYSTG